MVCTVFYFLLKEYRKVDAQRKTIERIQKEADGYVEEVLQTVEEKIRTNLKGVKENDE